MARRFSIFFFGVLIGVMVIRFAFPGRFVEYTQYFDMNYRVLYHLKSDTIYLSSGAQCYLDCYNISKDEVFDVLDGGKINFEKSDQRSNPCKFYIVEKDGLNVGFDICDKKVTLRKISLNQDSCICD
tara:strand:+ start:18490 stop:18870 length:381 start_codon:yes stop_codon:yes gene_type:complete